MVLVYAETHGGKFKKNALEAVTYGKKLSALVGSDMVALTIGNASEAGSLGKYGASKVYNVAGVDGFDSRQYASIVAQAAQQLGATAVVLSNSSAGKAITGRVAVRLNAGNVSGVTSLPTVDGGSFKVRKNVFSGKAAAEYTINSPIKVLSVMGNTIPPEATGSGDAAVEALSVNIPAASIKVLETKTEEGIVPLPEAELVVSAGRGMKGPENWGMVEDLAKILGATTACSRPVADAHWRPHHEHVGQTGIAIRPNLYIAIGISGAIQHLAGVNQSKCIVVINKDPEAPFFKAADYGVVGDAFEVLPRLTNALKKFKTS